MGVVDGCRILILAGILFGSAAAAGGPDAVRTLQSHDWQVSEAQCAGRCPDDVATFARRMIGTDIVARGHAFVSSFADACPDEAGYDAYSRTAARAVGEIERALPPGTASKLGTLGWPPDPVTGIRVYCGRGTGRAAVANIVAIDAGRLLVMIEGGMFLVAVPKP